MGSEEDGIIFARYGSREQRPRAYRLPNQHSPLCTYIFLTCFDASGNCIKEHTACAGSQRHRARVCSHWLAAKGDSVCKASVAYLYYSLLS
jgi:hypothetical protein